MDNAYPTARFSYWILTKDCLNSARELAVAANFSSSSKIVGLVILPIISSISEEICPNRTVKTVFMASRLELREHLTFATPKSGFYVKLF
ncbi:hypothetical protein PN482_15370 [Microcystis aeruginosa CS-555/01A07]|uniref:hypothetical protein n=1 Tax=Microcystis aeruginosa TaxID=1126 RepID=UPI00233054FA|nr:hypothetical protein [Microcystis aeruginosa]MDB9430242.1 hypothetical protein [Microcystis aeruginosa CS-555/01A07]